MIAEVHDDLRIARPSTDKDQHDNWVPLTSATVSGSTLIVPYVVGPDVRSEASALLRRVVDAASQEVRQESDVAAMLAHRERISTATGELRDLERREAEMRKHAEAVLNDDAADFARLKQAKQQLADWAVELDLRREHLRKAEGGMYALERAAKIAAEPVWQRHWHAACNEVRDMDNELREARPWSTPEEYGGIIREMAINAQVGQLLRDSQGFRQRVLSGIFGG